MSKEENRLICQYRPEQLLVVSIIRCLKRKCIEAFAKNQLVNINKISYTCAFADKNLLQKTS